MKQVVAVVLSIAPTVLAAGGVFDGADVVFLGELHDNAGHHERQAEYVTDLQPSALVFEMLTQAQADRITPELLADPAALEATLGWTESGWPDFQMYYPIFQAASETAFFGAAVPRDRARSMMQDGVVASFRGDAELFGLTTPLPETQQAARQVLQLSAHCDAMPDAMLPMMVDIQRLRDAELAYSALQALDQVGPPVVVITGNGHARLDWGAPVYVTAVAPDVRIAALGQGEEGATPPEGVFDQVSLSPPVDRGDPCEAFR